MNIDEDTLVKALQEFDPDLYSPQFTYGSATSLHMATELGYTALAKQILNRGYIKLPWVEDGNSWYPVQCAVHKEHFGTAEVLLRHMKDRYS